MAAGYHWHGNEGGKKVHSKEAYALFPYIFSSHHQMSEGQMTRMVVRSTVQALGARDQREQDKSASPLPRYSAAIGHESTDVCAAPKRQHGPKG